MVAIALAGCGQTTVDVRPEVTSPPETASSQAAPIQEGDPAYAWPTYEISDLVRPVGWWGDSPPEPRYAQLARDHPDLVLINTWHNVVVDVVERDANGTVHSRYPSEPVLIDPQWPPRSFVVLDAHTHEMLDAVEIAETISAAQETSRRPGAGPEWDLLSGEDAEQWAALAAGSDFTLVEARTDRGGQVGGLFEDGSGIGVTFKVTRGTGLVLAEGIDLAPYESMDLDGFDARVLAGPDDVDVRALSLDATCAGLVSTYRLEPVQVSDAQRAFVVGVLAARVLEAGCS
ncbi:hypothetical protein [Georgenia faecalis]|uniref:hypothetical protein n=1 Tax=Georgenia faecalis TaxID=2483799 RepID=UPI000FDBA995|nr:hypothetical protein [Georgenia faecalis]